MRWAALAVLVVAFVIGFWPEIHSMLVFKDESAAGTVVVPVTSPAIALPSTEVVPAAVENVSGNVVVTTVHSPAVAAQAAHVSSAAASASTSGVSDAR